MTLEERIDHQNQALKDFGTCMFRSWERAQTYDVLIDGYLLDPVEWEVPGNGGVPAVKKLEYRPMLISVVGKKRRIEGFIKLMGENEYIFPKSHEPYSGGTNGYRVKPWFHKEPDLKKGGLLRETEHIAHTMEYRQVAYRRELVEVHSEGDYLRAFMLGTDKADAEQGFPRILGESLCPFLDEWLEPLKAAILKQDGWIVEMVGHQMFGSRVQIPKAGLLALVQSLVKDNTLKIPASYKPPAAEQVLGEMQSAV
ncbi:hypothetical protein [Geoalkalibacter halelectricus]|uniref:hypothetical protein n=1 Tax=Geoalkalibacter halelectricus TaxID=2847045 RepID=UPI003D24C8D4